MAKAEYVEYMENYRGSKRALMRSYSLSEARKWAIRRIKNNTTVGTFKNADIAKVVGDRYEVIGWVQILHENGEEKYYYRPWASKNKDLRQYAHCPMIEIDKDGKTIKKSLNPSIASAYNRKKKYLPFGL